MRKTSHKLTLTLGLLVSGIFFWLALRDVEFDAVGAAFGSANLWLAIPFLIALGLFYWLKAVRWSYLLAHSKPLTPTQLVPSMMIGFAGNNILPVRLGELLRIYVLGKEHEIRISMVLGTIVLERIFDTISVLVIVVIAMFFATDDISEFYAVRTMLVIAVAGAIGAVIGFAVAPRWLTVPGTWLLKLLPGRIRPKIVEKLGQLRQGFSSLNKISLILKISANSIVQWALLAACVYLSIIAFDAPATPTVAVLILALIVVGVSLPAAPGYIGTIEYCFVLGLGFFNVDANEAISIGVYYHVLTFCSVTLAGLFYVRRYDASFRALAKDSTDVKNRDS